MVCFGDPSGAFTPATENERVFLRVVTRGYPAAERQVETCLVSRWDGLRLAIRVIDGPPLIHRKKKLGPLLGPTVVANSEDVVLLASTFWVNDRGMIVSVAIDVCEGTSTALEPMQHFVDASRCGPERLHYPNR